EFLDLARASDYARSVARERQRAGPANALAGAGDQCNAIFHKGFQLFSFQPVSNPRRLVRLADPEVHRLVKFRRPFGTERNRKRAKPSQLQDSASEHPENRVRSVTVAALCWPLGGTGSLARHLAERPPWGTVCSAGPTILRQTGGIR